MSTIRNRWFLAVLVCIATIGGIIALVKSKRAVEVPPIFARQSPPQHTKTEINAGLASPKTEKLDVKTGRWPVDNAWHQRIQGALATQNPQKWEPVLGELTNPMFNQTDAIGELSALLNYPDWNVKVRVAQLLLILGSYEGVRTLQSALNSVAKGEAVSLSATITAASVLHQYRQSISPHDLYAAYEHFKSPELLTIATMQQVPEVRELVQQRRARNEQVYNTEWMAAYLGMDDPASVAQYTRLLAARPDAQLLGHWALYRATGDSNHLDYVISVAKEAVGLNPPSDPKRELGDLKYQAMDYLQITVKPPSTRALEEIADYAAVSSGGNTADFTRAFGALYYIHQDYEYVDQRVLAFLNKTYAGPSINGNLMMKIAVSRGSSRLLTAAQAFNLGAYERALVEVQGRPVETWWPNLNHVPITVAPVVKK